MINNKRCKVNITMLLSYVVIGFLWSCDLLSNEDDEYVNSYILELASVWTDSEGDISVLQNDKDERLIISNTEEANKCFISANYQYSIRLEPDTSYRALCYYEKTGNMAQVQDMYYVLSKIATPTAELARRSIKQDPVEIQSIWISGGFLNLIIRINVFDKRHDLFSIKQSDTSSAIFSLYHDSKNDSYGYFRTSLISIPLSGYNLNEGDSIFFKCKGYDKDYNYSFVY